MALFKKNAPQNSVQMEEFVSNKPKSRCAIAFLKSQMQHSNVEMRLLYQKKQLRKPVIGFLIQKMAVFKVEMALFKFRIADFTRATRFLKR